MGSLTRASKATAVRYERDRPGELVHMDVKKSGRIPDGGGWRAGVIAHGGRTAGQKKIKVGFDYGHSQVDDHSRLAYSEILRREGRHLRGVLGPELSTTSPPTASPASNG